MAVSNHIVGRLVDISVLSAQSHIVTDNCPAVDIGRGG